MPQRKSKQKPPQQQKNQNQPNETKPNPSNLLHLYIEIKSILQVEQFQMVNILSGMGKRYPQMNTQGPAMPSSIQGVLIAFKPQAHHSDRWHKTWAAGETPESATAPATQCWPWLSWVIVLFPLWLEESTERKAISWAEQLSNLLMKYRLLWSLPRL